MEKTVSKEIRKERLQSHQYEKIIQDLLEKVGILESNLKIFGKEKIRFVTRIKEMEREIDYLKKEQDKASQQNSVATLDSEKYKQQLETLKEQYKSTLEVYRTKCDLLSKELTKKSNENDKLIEDLKEKEDKINYISVNSTMSLRFSDTYKEDLDRQILINKTQSKRINELEKEINELYISKKCEGNLILENEHLKEDNIRLLQMLKGTKEYEDFGYLNQTLPGGIRYINEATTINKKKFTRRQREQNEKEIKKNQENWVSSEVYNMVLDYNNKYHLSLNEKIINDLLANLNKIWRERENLQKVRIKAKYQREIIELKKKKGNSHSSSNYNFAKDTKGNTDDEYSKKLISNLKQATLSFNESKRGLEKKINTLTMQLNEKTLKNPTISKDVDITRENTLIIDKVIKEINRVETLFEEMHQQYQERVKDTETMVGGEINLISNIKLMQNSNKWLYESLKDIVKDSKSKFTLWKSQYETLKY